MAEFSQNSTGYLQTTEWPFYVFDATFIFISMALFNIIHPSKYLKPEPDSAIPVKNSSTINQVAQNGMPTVSTDIVMPVESVERF